MSEANYRPSGDLQGDTKAMPDRGTGTGMDGDSYGASLSPDAINRTGGMGGAAKSDPAERCLPLKP
jgi:hypothetical protein